MRVVGRHLIVTIRTGREKETVYHTLREKKEEYYLETGNYQIHIKYEIRRVKGSSCLCMIVSGKCVENSSIALKGQEQKGIAVAMCFDVAGVQSDLQVGVPSAVYGNTVDKAHAEYHSFMEDRLTGPMIVLYDHKSGESVSVKKLNSAKISEQEIRRRGEKEFMHRTDVVSLGYGFDGTPYFSLRFPYEEKENSVALNSEQSPVEAYYPLDEKAFSYTFEYEMVEGKYKTFTDALYEEYKTLAQIKEERGDRVGLLPFDQKTAVELRKKSVVKTFREFGENGAGFFFHFDPRRGYSSEPSGFGSSFDIIPQETYTHVLEYGFTGRQIDIALTMAKKNKEDMEYAEKVIDFFVNKCVCEDGWVYSMYDIEQNRPFASFGDSTAPKLHYMNIGEEEGNYLRTMTEPMYDLLRAYHWFQDKGHERKEWIEATLRYASFLIRKQNRDGSWYRAYTKKGEPVFAYEGSEYQEEEGSRKASTVIPIPFLCTLSKYWPEDKRYREAAIRAGSYTLEHELRRELYQGGTMDNPNIVDKEAVQYVMAGMYSLYELTGKVEYIEAAMKAAKQFVTWNYIWNAPMRKGTILREKGFFTKGMGAINSIWCGGVVDIYSLFHIRELYLIGEKTGENFIKEIAAWISIATHQILSWPGDSMGFSDTGMQPEGFGICPQGMDEGMINKGDIWGTLGWIYSAGIGGMERYLESIQMKLT